MKKFGFGCMILSVTFILLAACGQSSPSTSNLLPNSSQAYTESLNQNSNTSASIESVPNTTTDFSFILDINEDEAFEIKIKLPFGITYNGGVLYQDPIGSLPEEIYTPRSDDFPKIGGVYSGNYESLDFITDTILQASYWTMDVTDYPYSDDPNLPGNTFYQYDDITVITYESLAEGSGILLKSTHFLIPLTETNFVCIWFLHNPDSVGAKAFFEQIVNQLEINEV